MKKPFYFPNLLMPIPSFHLLIPIMHYLKNICCPNTNQARLMPQVVVIPVRNY
ncbi:hypothetical protein [Hydrotalea sandarakina]|uniref:hypothetical protein n=1 Tax=Hydrotalea sandarakina TaxID=1004304 RepID=UPI0014767282|nr:hypothetical protein [Hydrotalea sandarakina]